MTHAGKRVVAVLGLWVLLAALAYGFVFAGQLARVDELRARRARLGELKGAIRSLADRYESLAPGENTTRWVSRVVPLMDRLASVHRVRLANVTPQASRPGGDFTTVGVSFGLAGAYADVAAFVADLERGGGAIAEAPASGGLRRRVMRVRDLELLRSGGEPILTGAARLEAYVR